MTRPDLPRRAYPGQVTEQAGRQGGAARPVMVRRLVVAPDGIPPAGRVLVRTGRVLLIEVGDSELATLAQTDPDAAARLWAPGEPEPHGIPSLTDAEREAVSAAALATPSDAARRLEGADWGDPAAQPPDRPR